MELTLDDLRDIVRWQQKAIEEKEEQLRVKEQELQRVALLKQDLKRAQLLSKRAASQSGAQATNLVDLERQQAELLARLQHQQSKNRALAVALQEAKNRHQQKLQQLAALQQAAAAAPVSNARTSPSALRFGHGEPTADELQNLLDEIAARQRLSTEQREKVALYEQQLWAKRAELKRALWELNEAKKRAPDGSSGSSPNGGSAVSSSSSPSLNDKLDAQCTRHEAAAPAPPSAALPAAAPRLSPPSSPSLAHVEPPPPTTTSRSPSFTLTSPIPTLSTSHPSLSVRAIVVSRPANGSASLHEAASDVRLRSASSPVRLFVESGRLRPGELPSTEARLSVPVAASPSSRTNGTVRTTDAMEACNGSSEWADVTKQSGASTDHSDRLSDSSMASSTTSSAKVRHRLHSVPAPPARRRLSGEFAIAPSPQTGSPQPTSPVSAPAGVDSSFNFVAPPRAPPPMPIVAHSAARSTITSPPKVAAKALISVLDPSPQRDPSVPDLPAAAQADSSADTSNAPTVADSSTMAVGTEVLTVAVTVDPSSGTNGVLCTDNNSKPSDESVTDESEKQQQDGTEEAERSVEVSSNSSDEQIYTVNADTDETDENIEASGARSEGAEGGSGGGTMGQTLLVKPWSSIVDSIDFIDDDSPSSAATTAQGTLDLTVGEHKAGGRRTRKVTFDPLALLLDASLEGELELVKTTASLVPDASAPNNEGITALHNAICAQHFDIVKFLVQFGCDVNAADTDGWTPLHCAASCNNLSMACLLVEHGASVYAQTLREQETPLDKCEEDDDGFEQCYNYLQDIQDGLGVVNDGQVFALFDYDAHNDDELAFCINQPLWIVRRGDDDENEWWWAKDQLQAPFKEGYVPRNFLGLFPRILPRCSGAVAGADSSATLEVAQAGVDSTPSLLPGPPPTASPPPLAVASSSPLALPTPPSVSPTASDPTLVPASSPAPVSTPSRTPPSTSPTSSPRSALASSSSSTSPTQPLQQLQINSHF